MAVRLELVAADGGAETFLGYASASDPDETFFLQVLQVIADDIPELSAPSQSTGRIEPVDVRRVAGEAADVDLGAINDLASTSAELEVAMTWQRVVYGAFRSCGDRPLVWRLSFDQGGSADDGVHEYATGAALAD
jgi:hypothetical protein